MPTRLGDKGVCFPADVYLGGVSGLGGGTATLTPQGNLSTLMFFATGNNGWIAADPNVLTLYGAAGLINPKPVARVGDKVATPAGTGIIISGSSQVSAA